MFTLDKMTGAMGPRVETTVLPQERRHNFKSGVQILLLAKRAENFGGCTPTYDILGVQQLQRDTRTAYRTAFSKVQSPLC